MSDKKENDVRRFHDADIQNFDSMMENNRRSDKKALAIGIGATAVTLGMMVYAATVKMPPKQTDSISSDSTTLGVADTTTDTDSTEAVSNDLMLPISEADEKYSTEFNNVLSNFIDSFGTTNYAFNIYEDESDFSDFGLIITNKKNECFFDSQFDSRYIKRSSGLTLCLDNEGVIEANYYGATDIIKAAYTATTNSNMKTTVIYNGVYKGLNEYLIDFNGYDNVSALYKSLSPSFGEQQMARITTAVEEYNNLIADAAAESAESETPPQQVDINDISVRFMFLVHPTTQIITLTECYTYFGTETETDWNNCIFSWGLSEGMPVGEWSLSDYFYKDFDTITTDEELFTTEYESLVNSLTEMMEPYYDEHTHNELGVTSSESGNE